MTNTSWPWRRIAGPAAGLLAILFGCAMLLPAVGFDAGEAGLLTRAGSVIALNAASARWMRLIPLACTAIWLLILVRLLRRLGASRVEAWVLVVLTAASPISLFLATHVDREPLFALLTTAALLALLELRPVLAGVLTGAAFVVFPGGIALVFAGIVAFATARRLRAAGIFAVASMIIIAPAAGWRLAHGMPHLQASERVFVAGSNAVGILEAVPKNMGAPGNLYMVILFVPLLLWAIWRRRQLLPDLFVFAYAVSLLLRVWPPEYSISAIYPFVLWVLWRALRIIDSREAVAAIVVVLFSAELVAGARDVWAGYVAWRPLQALFQAIPQGAAVVAAGPVPFRLVTGHRAIPGYRFDPYHVFYDRNVPLVTPDVLQAEIFRAGGAVVAVTPDDDVAYFRSVEALERGGILEAVPAPHAAAGYRLLRPR